MAKKVASTTSVFEPVIYASRGKAFTLWVKDGEKDVKVQFNSNGRVGVFVAKDAATVAAIEETEYFRNGHVWRSNGQPQGASGPPIVVGPRSALTQPQPLPVEPEIAKIVAESNTAARRPITTE